MYDMPLWRIEPTPYWRLFTRLHSLRIFPWICCFPMGSCDQANTYHNSNHQLKTFKSAYYREKVTVWWMYPLTLWPPSFIPPAASWVSSRPVPDGVNCSNPAGRLLVQKKHQAFEWNTIFQYQYDSQSSTTYLCYIFIWKWHLTCPLSNPCMKERINHFLTNILLDNMPQGVAKKHGNESPLL